MILGKLNTWTESNYEFHNSNDDFKGILVSPLCAFNLINFQVNLLIIEIDSPLTLVLSQQGKIKIFKF